MRARAIVAGLALACAGCETFEPYSVDYDEIINESGVSVSGNLMEDIAGARWWQFSASNANGFSVCVQTRLQDNASTSGHSMGAIYLVGAGETLDIGYVELPAAFNTSTHVWAPDASGQCGSPPG